MPSDLSDLDEFVSRKLELRFAGLVVILEDSADDGGVTVRLFRGFRVVLLSHSLRPPAPGGYALGPHRTTRRSVGGLGHAERQQARVALGDGTIGLFGAENASPTFAATALASRGGTELPICRKPCHFVTWKRNQSG